MQGFAEETKMNADGAGFAAALVAIHWTPLAIAAWRWPLRKLDWSFGSALAVLPCALAWLIVLFCLLIFTDVREHGFATGHAAGWYVIFSLMTLGALPLSVIGAHVLAGRLAGYWIRRRAARRAAG